ncbi:poly(A) polymerase small subunit [Canarypox virus]|uniref:Cap-specific mRNA (nucleoside-2'-O-)-methyltransferase n=2 Tax=Canarypox virus TaxID=44088 RepID=A0A1V0QGD7_CNPV|nr:poly(A) polymerase small subunit [Canarypox virus]ARE67403.1 SWPV2-ORF167 [Shearwaterpox virus]QRM15455.1 poly(A) polymerase small subunit PAPS [Mudlarkpox virus]QRM15810.1 poly(a) polymerase small subunit paps [Penguinpox virus 2]QRM16145.1 poly(a) polymerase small subunit paps [Albatrosspox virus]AAR83525.1 CNPV179 poly(A) polymerase small subunit PAPS [Canarypox virus]
MNVIELSKPFIFYDELVHRLDYDKAIECSCKAKFQGQGQLKLLLGELYFLNTLLRNNMLYSDMVIVYIGSAPGSHIKFLYSHLESLGIRLKWILIDGRDHDSSLSTLRNVTIIKRFVDEQYLFKLHEKLKKEKVILISDIRSLRGKEPTSEDLLHDYSLQNLMISILRPIASSLKWRCPFPDQWIRDFYIPLGDEFLQPFAPSYSAEMRLLGSYTRGPIRLIRITREAAVEYEKKMFYLNNKVRKSIVLDFDYPRQEYDFFHMFYILKDLIVSESLEFTTDKQKVIFLQDSIFKSLNIKPTP